MSEHLLDAAGEISGIQVGTGYESVTIGIDEAMEAARALDAAGLLVTPEHDAAVAAEWADHFEVRQGAVGPERLTVESMIAALRGPRPFGRMAGESDADA